MGANAQTSVPTFTALEVLTAANMNISARTGVPVFADTTARDAAFGGTGEKTLAEGQLAYVENLTGVAQLQYYDGAAWVSLSGSGLVYLTGTSVSAVSSFSLPNSTFTATYRNYRIVIEGVGANDGNAVTMRLRASGSDNTTSNYQSSVGGANTSGTFSGTASSGGSSFTLGGSSNTKNYYNFDIMAPQVAVNTAYGGTGNAAIGGNMTLAAIGGFFTATTAFDSLSIIIASPGTFTGTYRVYGYADS